MEAPAIIDLSQSRERLFSFEQMELLINSVVCHLRLRGLSSESRIAIAAENSAEYLAVYLGIRRAGFVAVPINIKLPANQIDYILRDSDSVLVFGDTERSRQVEWSIPFVDFKNLDFECKPTPAEADGRTEMPNEERMAVILYTSGSTGIPKGVAISHSSRTRLIRRMSIVKPSIQLIASPFFHMNGLTNTEACFASHSSMVLLPRFQTPAYVKALAKYHVESLTAVPAMMAMVLSYCRKYPTERLDSVKRIRLASAPVSRVLLDQIQVRFPAASIEVLYGLTEVGPSLFGPHPLGIRTPQLSVGYPKKGIEYRLVNDVLFVKSPFMLVSYHKKSDLFNASMTKDGFFNTRDKFRVDEQGFYFFTGRLDDMFVCGGENVFPSEIEAVLAGHPAVSQVAVLGLPDEIRGMVPCAFVVCHPDAIATESELRAHVQAHSPSYHIPKYIWFLEYLPLVGSNKVDRNELKRIALRSGFSAK